jgi:hypothetical protein
MPQDHRLLKRSSKKINMNLSNFSPAVRLQEEYAHKRFNSLGR